MPILRALVYRTVLFLWLLVVRAANNPAADSLPAVAHAAPLAWHVGGERGSYSRRLKKKKSKIASAAASICSEPKRSIPEPPSTPRTYNYSKLIEFAALRARSAQSSVHCNVVVVAFVMGSHYTHYALNWAAYLTKAGVRTHFVVDMGSESLLSVHHDFPVFVSGMMDEKNFGVGDVYRKRLWRARWEMVAALLRGGFTVVHSDIDAIWLRDPLPFLAGVTGDAIASHGQSDAKWLICMGWLMLRPTAAVMGWLLLSFFAKLDLHGDDQVAFNMVLARVKWRRDPYICTASGYTDITDCRDVQTRDWIDDMRLKGLINSTQAALCREPVTGRWQNLFTVTLLPQRMIRRHGCWTKYRHCYANISNPVEGLKSIIDYKRRGDERLRAGSEFVIHCRDLNGGTILMDQKRTPAQKAQGLNSMGLWNQRSGLSDSDGTLTDPSIKNQTASKFIGCWICKGPHATDCWVALNKDLRNMPKEKLYGYIPKLIARECWGLTSRKSRGGRGAGG